MSFLFERDQEGRKFVHLVYDSLTKTYTVFKRTQYNLEYLNASIKSKYLSWYSEIVYDISKQVDRIM